MQQSKQLCQIGRVYPPIIETVPNRPSLDEICFLVARLLNESALNMEGEPLKISPNQILMKNRKHELVLARYLFVHIAVLYKYFDVEIRRFLNRDHTTVLYAKSAVADFIETRYPLFISYYNFVSTAFGLTPLSI